MKPIIYITPLIVSACCLLAVLTGCRQSMPPVDTPRVSISYKDLCGLATEQVGTMDDENVRQWIENEYNSTPLKSQKVISGELMMIYTWEYNGIRNAFLRDGHLYRVSFQEIKNGPTLGQITIGLGTPDMVDRDVQTYGGHVVYFFGLDYPQLGISAKTAGEMTAIELSRPAEEWAVKLKEDMRVDHVECYIPGSMEDVLRKIFFLSPEGVMRQMQRRVSWPGFETPIPLEYAMP